MIITRDTIVAPGHYIFFELKNTKKMISTLILQKIVLVILVVMIRHLTMSKNGVIKLILQNGKKRRRNPVLDQQTVFLNLIVNRPKKLSLIPKYARI